MFHIVINDLVDRTRNTLIKFGGDTKLRSTGSSPEGRIKIQNYSEKFHLYPKREEKRQILSSGVMYKIFTQSGTSSYKTQNE